MTKRRPSRRPPARDWSQPLGTAQNPIRVGLVGGRHRIDEVDTYLATGPALPDGEEAVALIVESAKRLAKQVQVVELYMTGYPAAAIPAVDALRKAGTRLTIMFWDRNHQEWFEYSGPDEAMPLERPA